MEEVKREVDPRGLSDPKEDDELGQFFAKLATLVPKLQCGWEELNSTSSDHTLSRDPWSHQGPDVSCRRCGADAVSEQIGCHHECSNQQHPITEAQGTGDNQINFIFTAEDSEACHKSLSKCNLRNNLDSNVNTQPIVCCNQSQSNKRLSGSNYAIKPCKVRNRLAPYRINKNDPRNHSASNKNHSRPTTRRTLQSSGEPQAEEQRLELITDVIDYIHTLKSLLDNSQTTRYDIASDIHILPQQPPLPEGLYSPRSSPGPAPLPSQGLVTPPSGATAFLGEAAPMDRAMELLEYKTGAISITA